MNTAAYVIRLTVVAMAMGILLPLMPTGSGRSVMRLSGSILLAVIALSPLVEMDVPDMADWTFPEMAEGESMAAIGEDAAMDARDAVIIQQTTAYILDKAASLGVEVTAEVELDERGVPEFVRIQGSIPSLIRRRLSGILEQELGIPKERQEWTLGN